MVQDGNYFLYGGYHQEGKILGQNEVAPGQNFRTPWIVYIISYHFIRFPISSLLLSSLISVFLSLSHFPCFFKSGARRGVRRSPFLASFSCMTSSALLLLLILIIIILYLLLLSRLAAVRLSVPPAEGGKEGTGKPRPDFCPRSSGFPHPCGGRKLDGAEEKGALHSLRRLPLFPGSGEEERDGVRDLSGYPPLRHSTEGGIPSEGTYRAISDAFPPDGGKCRREPRYSDVEGEAGQPHHESVTLTLLALCRNGG